MTTVVQRAADYDSILTGWLVVEDGLDKNEA